MTLADFRPEYHRFERQWYLWDGREAIRDEAGEIRLFVTAQAALDWLASRPRT